MLVFEASSRKVQEAAIGKGDKKKEEEDEKKEKCLFSGLHPAKKKKLNQEKFIRRRRKRTKRGRTSSHNQCNITQSTRCSIRKRL